MTVKVEDRIELVMAICTLPHGGSYAMGEQGTCSKIEAQCLFVVMDKDQVEICMTPQYAKSLFKGPSKWERLDNLSSA